MYEVGPEYKHRSKTKTRREQKHTVDSIFAPFTPVFSMSTLIARCTVSHEDLGCDGGRGRSFKFLTVPHFMQVGGDSSACHPLIER